MLTDDAVERAEQAVLAARMLFPEALHATWLPGLDEFMSEAHAAISAAIDNCARTGPVDALAVRTELERTGQAEACGGLVYLTQLCQSPAARAATKRHAMTVREAAKTRRDVAVRRQIAALATGADNSGEVGPRLRELAAEIGRSVQEAPHGTQPRMLALDQLARRRAPARHWFRDGWLGGGVTLLPGKGGEGKSTLAQHEATCGSLGRPYFAPECTPYTSLVWNCEDEHDDMWRRQEQICAHEGIELTAPAGRLFLVSRYGCDNALMYEAQGALASTRLLEELRQQVNDLAIDVLWLDNSAHLLAGNHDDRTQVTQFINALNGLVSGRPFGVVLLAHVSRAAGSEFTGSAAWENAARMRWYLGSQLPDRGTDAGVDGRTSASEARYLCRRKSNYSTRDYAKFSMRSGLLVPEQSSCDRIGGLVSAMDERRCDELCVAGFRTLCGMGIRTTDGKTSPDYLPSQIVAKGLAPGYTKSDLSHAVNRLMARGFFVRAVVGKHANRSPKYGLALAGENP